MTVTKIFVHLIIFQKYTQIISLIYHSVGPAFCAMADHLSFLSLVLATCATPYAGQNTTASNATTTGPGRVGWVSSESRRSTWGIICSCAAVFLICSWKCTHLDIPTIEESRGGWHKWPGVPYWP